MKVNRLKVILTINIITAGMSLSSCSEGTVTESPVTEKQTREKIVLSETVEETVETEPEMGWSIYDERMHLTREELDEILRLLEEGCD